jgi:hypothetical protein
MAVDSAANTVSKKKGIGPEVEINWELTLNLAFMPYMWLSWSKRQWLKKGPTWTAIDRCVGVTSGSR